MRSDEQIVCADRPAGSLEVRSQLAVNGVSRRFERKNIHSAQHDFELPGQPHGPFLCSTVTQFGRHDDACADLLFPDFLNAIRRFARADVAQDRKQCWCRAEIAWSQINRFCRRIFDWRKFLIERRKGCKNGN